MLEVVPQLTREASIASMQATSHAAADDQSMREAALHAFALFGAGIVHEINNPLATALLSAQVALRSLPADTDPRARRCLERAVESIQTTAAAVRTMVRESSQKSAGWCTFDVRDVLRFVTLVMKPHADESRCHIIWRVSQHESLVTGNPIELEIALANLVYRLVVEGAIAIAISSHAARDRVAIQIECERRNSVERAEMDAACDGMTTIPQAEMDEPPANDDFIEDMIRANGGILHETCDNLGGMNITISLPRYDT